MTLESVESLVITLMGVALIYLSHLLGSRKVMRFPAAVPLAFSGVLAIVWQLPRLLPVPSNLLLPFEVAEVLFFTSISLCMMLFAIGVLIGQAKTLARAEETLARQSAELERAAVVRQMAAVVESSNDAIISQDMEGKVVSWNPAAEKLYGFSFEEARGKPISIIIPHTHTQEFSDLWERVLTGFEIQDV